MHMYYKYTNKKCDKEILNAGYLTLIKGDKSKLS